MCVFIYIVGEQKGDLLGEEGPSKEGEGTKEDNVRDKRKTYHMFSYIRPRFLKVCVKKYISHEIKKSLQERRGPARGGREDMGG